MNELLPLLLVPTTSTLSDSQSLMSSGEVNRRTHLNGVGSFRLRIRLGLFT
jgi:hypothetical protein